MKLEEIKELIHMLEASTLTALELHQGNDSIRLERSGQIPTGQMMAAPVQTQVVSAVEVPFAETKQPEGNPVVSPLVGVFYAAPSPEDAPFVTVGSTVKKGDVVCIVEAMKLMNEITAEQDGTIVKVCVENGNVVEYGQPLFYIA